MISTLEYHSSLPVVTVVRIVISRTPSNIDSMMDRNAKLKLTQKTFCFPQLKLMEQTLLDLTKKIHTLCLRTFS